MAKKTSRDKNTEKPESKSSSPATGEKITALSGVAVAFGGIRKIKISELGIFASSDLS